MDRPSPWPWKRLVGIIEPEPASPAGTVPGASARHPQSGPSPRRLAFLGPKFGPRALALSAQVRWRDQPYGYWAADCKSAIPGSNPGGAFSTDQEAQERCAGGREGELLDSASLEQWMSESRLLVTIRATEPKAQL
jgi:hypothetical protein